MNATSTHTFTPNSEVMHPTHGAGVVLMTDRTTAVVRFSHGLEQVLATDLTAVLSVVEAIRQAAVSPAIEVVARMQAEAIQSVNNAWGVFTRSRISLLPHQLWVCHRALQQWPIRLLVADDVGMGKTIEAGLMLWPLLANRKVQRLLILAPPKLVDQWQYRLKSMFDIRAAKYLPELDTAKTDFWGIHSLVVASLPTLRADKHGRHDRLLDAPVWDMVIVDEAHHLNVEENSPKTLGFELVQKMERAGKIVSCVLFTATPHRGKDHGFWSLMSLLDAKVFGPNQNEGVMLHALPHFLIRNAKQRATDMQGQFLFKPVQQYPEIFYYTSAEESFYRLMSEFIVTGKAYASSLNKKEGGQVILVLIALQKLASSSVAAVVSALHNRQKRLRGLVDQSRAELIQDAIAENDTNADEKDDTLDALRKWLKNEANERLRLMENEGEYLDELVHLGQKITQETRVMRVLEIIQQRFPNDPVLLFTEYKRTQALVVAELMAKFGQQSVGFINGDNRLDDVRMPDGRIASLSRRREDACDAFNSGRLRFLVSTEAGGEGIDLQERCNALIHVDLPWNPMRLHQRVGRLNRYGQKRTVSVVSLRNPDTVEAQIWQKLEAKLAQIMRSVGSAMDEPEDLLQLVLGMTRSSEFDAMFAGGAGLSKDRLDKWFDQTAGTFGGESAIHTIQKLVGHADSFDVSGLKDVPPVDLPDLLSFFSKLLQLNHRRPKEEGLALSFKTPEEWLTSHAIRRMYENLTFDRSASVSSGDLMGVGHPLMEKGLQQALLFAGSVAVIPKLPTPLLVIAVSDLVTGSGASNKRLIFGVTTAPNGNFSLWRDWEVLKHLNALHALSTKAESINADEESSWQTDAMALTESALVAAPTLLRSISLPFTAPQTQLVGLLLPSA